MTYVIAAEWTARASAAEETALDVASAMTAPARATLHYREHAIERALSNLAHRHVRVLEPIVGEALR